MFPPTQMDGARPSVVLLATVPTAEGSDLRRTFNGLAGVAVFAVLVAACSSSSTSSRTTSVRAAPTTTTPAAWNGEYIPGTASTWSPLSKPATLVSGASDEYVARSNDSTYVAALFVFPTEGQAKLFWARWPGPANSIVGDALGYSLLGPNSDSKAGVQINRVDLRSCFGGVLWPPLSTCSNGSQSFSIGVAEFLTEHNLVLIAAWLPGGINPTGNECALVKVDSYVMRMKNLLTQTTQ